MMCSPVQRCSKGDPFRESSAARVGGVDHQQSLAVGVRSRRLPVEGSRDHFAVVDDGD